MDQLEINKSAQIKILTQEGSVFLYTRKNADKILQNIYITLSKKIHWNDSEDYFTRMIFCQLLEYEDLDSTEDFGIGLKEYSDTDVKIIIDYQNQKIYIDSVKLTNILEYTYEVFLESFTLQAKL